MIKEGMIVRYNPKWCTENERHCFMVVLEAYPDVKRCLVQRLNTGMAIAPTETVTFDMIVPTGVTVDENTPTQP